MNRRRGRILTIIFAFGFSLFAAEAFAQAAIDSMKLELFPPDSVYVRREGSRVIIGWYPPTQGSVTGSRDFRNWYVNDPEVSRVGIEGSYVGTIDRTLTITRIIAGTVQRVRVGETPSIRMLAETKDRFDTYSMEFNLGASYIPGSPIPMQLRGQKSGKILDTGISLTFSEGVVDTTFGGLPAFITIDLQTYEGFHIWRGMAPQPSKCFIIEELSRDDAYFGQKADSLYFLEWPKLDGSGKPYYEYADEDAFAGFTYYYFVSCFDRGYFKGRTLFNKLDNHICDEDLENPLIPGEPIDCESVARMVVMTVDARTGVEAVYAVPNPYRTGTSAETSPYYHNFPDGCIKFFNMPKDAEIKIYTVAGDLIWEHHHSSPTGEDGVVSWPVKNRDGQEVSSGVYIYRVEASNGESMYGRIIIIR